MIEFLIEIDKNIFHFINKTIDNSFFNLFIPALTNLHNIAWVKWGLLPAALIIWYFNQKKKMPKIFLALVITIAVCDNLSYRLIKKAFHRPRPHHVAEMQSIVKMNYGPKSSSFPSNHAFTGMGIAVVLSAFYPQAKLAFIIVALMLGFSRIYVGVHYPSDVLAGFIFGSIMGWILIWSLFKKINFFGLQKIQ